MVLQGVPCCSNKLMLHKCSGGLLWSPSSPPLTRWDFAAGGADDVPSNHLDSQCMLARWARLLFRLEPLHSAKSKTATQVYKVILHFFLQNFPQYQQIFWGSSIWPTPVAAEVPALQSSLDCQKHLLVEVGEKKFASRQARMTNLTHSWLSWIDFQLRTLLHSLSPHMS